MLLQAMKLGLWYKIADLHIVIEDEILLALPIVNYHNIEDCTSALNIKADTDLARLVLIAHLVFYNSSKK